MEEGNFLVVVKGDTYHYISLMDESASIGEVMKMIESRGHRNFEVHRVEKVNFPIPEID